MRINFVTFGMRLTGGIRVVAEIINHLAERGHQMSLVTFGSPEDLNWINLKAKVYYANRSLPQKISGYLYWQAFGFQPWPEEETRRLLKVMPDCDINVATISYSAYAVNRSGKGVPFHYYMHYEPLVREEGYKKKIIEESYFLPTKKIVNSSWLARQIKERTNQDVAGLVFPAIDHSIFYPRKEKSAARKGSKIRIVSLAKYKWWKGLPDALKAIQMVRDRGYDVDFQTFGGVFDRNILPEEVKNIEFTFVGSRINEQLAEFYSDADILISASYFESFPLPPIEAMACGTPVVTTVYGTEDYVFNGRNALVVEPKRPEQMAEAIIELIENDSLYNQLREEGIKTAKSFTWEKTAEKMEEISKKTLESNE
ncbi:glycosyltransferase family 4 protein [Candidatus Falkowbacteria bacterium]|nr:glycosyltransferase family 4 protein [Candidatus Falkowbacteria bacterium]